MNRAIEQRSTGKWKRQYVPIAKRNQEILHLYEQTGLSVGEIAIKFGVSTALVSIVAKQKGLPLRGRGRRPLLEPTEIQKQMIAASNFTTYAEVAARYGVTRQRIFQIVRRWKDWTN